MERKRWLLIRHTNTISNSTKCYAARSKCSLQTRCSLNRSNTLFKDRLSLSSLEQLGVLLRVGLLNIALSNLLHHEVSINDNILSELATANTPLACNSQDANRRLSVDEGVDAVGDVGEGELVCCLSLVRIICCEYGARKKYLANGLLVDYGVGCGCGLVAGLEGVADECGAEGLDHEVVVVEGGDDDGGVGAANGSLDVGGRHFEVGVVNSKVRS